MKRLVLYPFPHSPSPLPSTTIHPYTYTMSDWNQPWSNSTTAPRISKYAYTIEKALLAGSLIGSILYGTSVHTFVYLHSLQCFGLF